MQQALKKSNSQLGQDRWVLKKTEYKRNGFFVEFGATDGISLSNTWLLEQEFGWTGICAEPNPGFYARLKRNRRCRVSNQCIGHVTGEHVEFILAGVYGGIRNFSAGDQHKVRRDVHANEGHIIRLELISLDDFLEQHQAPRQIDYISIDTEGSEYEILRTFPFEKWDVHFFTIEHNFSEQREKIFDLMSSRGYSRTESKWDDWYEKLKHRNFYTPKTDKRIMDHSLQHSIKTATPKDQLKALLKTIDIPETLARQIDHWLTLIDNAPSGQSQSEVLHQWLAERPGQLSALKNWARHLRFTGPQPVVTLAYEILLTLAPHQTQSYINLAIQRQLDGRQPTLDLLDALLIQRSQGRVSLEKLRRRFAEHDIRGYAVKLPDSGLGDQLMMGAMSARLAELLGLEFQGIVLPLGRKFGYTSTLFQEVDHAYQYLGLARLPVLKLPDVWIPFSVPKTKGPSRFDIYLNALCDLMDAPLRPSSVMCFPFLYPLASLLSDETANYLSNQFTRQIRSAYASRATARNKVDDRPIFLLHLRLGDSANIHGLAPDQVLIPHLDELIPIEHIRTHPRFDHWDDWIKLSLTLRQHFGDALRLVLISDGLDRTFKILRDPLKRSHFERLGADLSDQKLADFEQALRKKIKQDFAHLDTIVLGEDEMAFEHSIEQILAAEFCISSSGHFVIQVSNTLRRPDDKILNYYTLQDQLRFIVTNDRIKTHLLNENFDNAISVILSDVAEQLSIKPLETLGRPNGIKLHLGCGNVFIPGFMHVDIRKYPHIDHVAPINDLTFIPEGTADLIYACHVLEHFKRSDILRVLMHWHRILRVGGILRLAVPDFAALCRLYNETGSLDTILPPLFGGQEHEWNMHYTAFDETNLTKLLNQSGFVQIQRYDWRETEHAHIRDFSCASIKTANQQDPVLISLNLQAYKA